MYQFDSQYVRSETDYRVEVARRALKPSRRRARALDEADHRALTRKS